MFLPILTIVNCVKYQKHIQKYPLNDLNEYQFNVIQDDFADIYQSLSNSDGIVFISAVYWSDMTECFKAFFDRLRRCDATKNHLLADKRCILMACAGGTGRGTLECLEQLERGLTHMGMRVYDRISVVRYNKDYILPALENAGETYAKTLDTGFDMYY